MTLPPSNPAGRSVPPINFEEKFIVLKMEDVRRLPPHLQLQVAAVLESIKDIRRQNGKSIHNTYYVVNQDEPYAPLIWDVISYGERTKPHP